MFRREKVVIGIPFYAMHEFLLLMNRTSIATVSQETRDAVAEYRDEHGYSNYDDAIQAMLEEVSK